MATELDVAAAPAVPFTQDEIERILQYEKIVQLSEIITSGKHPRIKIPANLARSTRSTTSPSLPSSTTAQAATTKNGLSGAAKAGKQVLGINGHESVAATSVTALPGLGLPPKETVGGHTQLSEFAAQRARIEAELREQASQVGKQRPDESDFLVDEILQKARQLEKRFTPPPLAISDITAAGKSAPSDSGDDDTFYSSKFNTPEFGLAARIPAESDHDDVSMHDSSDYEPELDTVPSPKPTSPKPTTQPLGLSDQQTLPSEQETNQVVGPFSQISSEAATQILASFLQAQNATQAVPIPPPSFQNNTSQVSWQGSSTIPSGPPPPVVRTHDLSPVAPQPEHISALATGAHLPEGQRGAIHGPATQAALLRRGEVSQSSADSSPQVGGRFADRKKGKKKTGKRKAENALSSPRIKSEPRSPSPIAAPLAPRPNKRQRQEVRPAPAPAPMPVPLPVPAGEARFRLENQYNPAAPRGNLEPPIPLATTRVVRESRGPVVYERIESGRYEHPQDVIVSRPQRGYEAYEPTVAGYAPRHTQPSYQPPTRPVSTPYVQLPFQSQFGARPAVGGPYSAIPAVYPAPPPRAAPPARASVRPDAFDRGHHGSPDMAPPPARMQQLSPTHGRILVDEYNREYLEPARAATVAESRQPNVVETVPYDPNGTFERPASRQVYATATQRYARVGSQMPTMYGEDDIVYRRTSPAFAPARRVITQPEYVTRDYVDYAPQREYSVRPVQYAGAPQTERGGAALEEAPPREYLIRPSTARPPEVARYDMPEPARYVEGVGMVRATEDLLGPNRGGALIFEGTGTSLYDGRLRAAGVPQHVAEGVYIEGHHGHELVREYSARPEPRVAAPREYNMRAAPASGPASQPTLMHDAPYYPEQPAPIMNRPPQEYVYPDDGVPREVYR